METKTITMSEYKINFFELGFLAATCIPPVPIARACFWDKMIDEYYHQMSIYERRHMYEWMNRNTTYLLRLVENEEVQMFDARYNPDNQYAITMRLDNGSEVIYECFKYKDEYRMTTNSSPILERIISIKKIEP